MQFTTFYLDSLYFGIDVMRVQEVLKRQELTPVPLSSTMVEGLINLRGQIITAIDLRARLNMPKRSADSASMNIIVESDDGSVSFVVDKVGDVIEVFEKDLEITPSTLTPEQRDVVSGVYKLSGKLLLEFDYLKGMNLQNSEGRS
jgi:purine-binding chemotaxis protein CheW